MLTLDIYVPLLKVKVKVSIYGNHRIVITSLSLKKQISVCIFYRML